MKKRKGFTLIELLVVIGIIVILMAILIPSLRKARNQARNVICQSHLKQWGTVFSLYIDENNGHFFEDMEVPWWQYSTFKFIRKSDFVWENTGNQKLADFACCPMAKKTSNDPNNNTVDWGVEASWPVHGHSLGAVGKTGSALEAWEIKTRYARETEIPGDISHYGSYGLSISLVHGSFWTPPSSAGGGGRKIDIPSVGRYTWRGLYIYSLKGQTNIPVLLDCALPYSTLYSSEQSPQDISCCINRHNGGVNSLFLDWSVRKVGLKELWKLKWHKDFDTNGPWTKAGGVQPEDWPEWMRSFKDY